jgi:beta-lactamase class D
MASKCVLALAIVAVLLGACAFAEDLKERPDLDAVFREQGVTSTFVLYDVPADRLTIVNRARAETRFVPASTFKIANSLIAL